MKFIESVQFLLEDVLKSKQQKILFTRASVTFVTLQFDHRLFSDYMPDSIKLLFHIRILRCRTLSLSFCGVQIFSLKLTYPF